MFLPIVFQIYLKYYLEETNFKHITKISAIHYSVSTPHYMRYFECILIKVQHANTRMQYNA